MKTTETERPTTGKEAAAGPPRKHPCPDCRMCQWCANTRCAVCRADDNQAAGSCREGTQSCTPT